MIDKLVDENGNSYRRESGGGSSDGCGCLMFLGFIFLAVCVGAYFLYCNDILSEKQCLGAITVTGWLCVAIVVGGISLAVLMIIIESLWEARGFIMWGLGIAALILFVAWVSHLFDG